MCSGTGGKMNERIKELAKQSRMVFWPTDPEVTELMTDIDIEKFAELIVRECAQVASDYDGAHYVGTAIEKHFGVEE